VGPPHYMAGGPTVPVLAKPVNRVYDLTLNFAGLFLLWGGRHVQEWGGWGRRHFYRAVVRYRGRAGPPKALGYRLIP